MRAFLGACICLFWVGAASAQTPPESAVVKFKEAERLFQSGRFIEAVQLYQQLANDEKAPDRDQCFVRVIEITMRLGRCDQAIAAGERYLALLDKAGDKKTNRLVEVQMAACWWALGHHVTAEKKLVKAMGESLAEFPLAAQVGAIELLARCQAQRSDKDTARKSWNKIESLVSQRLRESGEPLDDRERVQLTRKLAESLRGQERYAQAETVLKSLQALHVRTKDVAGQRDAIREIAGLYREQMKLTEAESAIDAAIKLHATLGQTAAVAEADLEAERSEILQLRKKSKDAKVWRDKAIEHYQEAFKRPESAAAQGTSVVLIFWKLQNLIQVSQQFRKALELTQTQAEQWAGGSLLTSKLDTEQGSLQYLLGATKEGRAKLRDAVDALERQSPWNLIELPRAYVNLAAVEAATDDLDKAERLVQKTLDLYRSYSLGDDTVVVEAYNLRGTIVAQRGDYSKAIQHFRDGLDRCQSQTLEGPLQRSNLLLNIALLHKSQGELPEAIRMCSSALEEFEKVADPDALGLAAFDAGLANMYLAQNQIGKAGERTKRLMKLCEIHGVDRGPLVVTAKHVQAIDALRRRDLKTAEDNWRELLKLQEREDQTLLLPRTLNYLGLTAELRKDYAGAEDLYTRALKLQTNNQRSFPATQFITLWRLANVVKPNRKDLARDYLEQAIRLVEKARLRTFGDAQQRATFFAQFGPAFEQSIDWMLQNRDVESAFQVLTRGRSRTLMDQLQLSNLDPLATLAGPQADALKRREEKLRHDLASLRARASIVGVEGLAPEETKKLLDEFDKAQADYAETWREIWNASPEYHALADPNLPEQVLLKLRAKVLKNGTLLLAYHVGKESSHVLLLGDGQTAQYFPLTVPEDLAKNIAPPDPQASGGALLELRGIKIVAKGAAKSLPPVPLPPLLPDGKMVPLTQDVARALVDRYRQDILDRDFSATRGFVVKARDPNRPLPPQRPELTGQTFLPKALRERLRELKPESIVVVPDGPLHSLPVETLVLEAGAKPKFAIDELPPLIYAPSGAILAVLADRPAPKRERASLLTVSNPAYLEGKFEEAAVAEGREGGFLGFAGQLPRLPFTETESKQIRKYFASDRVTAIGEADATERNVVQAVRGKTIVHIAAHGFADSRFGNLFGALALSPSATSAASDDDGFLSLHEIYKLPLQDCDLAVLSACLTHVGPQQPMEAGVTLANGFLSAGARRVVASHWNVADRSTSQLMSYFFEALTRETKEGNKLSTAQAMQEARQRLRSNAENNWSAPFYWAPFVVLGSPD